MCSGCKNAREVCKNLHRGFDSRRRLRVNRSGPIVVIAFSPPQRSSVFPQRSDPQRSVVTGLERRAGSRWGSPSARLLRLTDVPSRHGFPFQPPLSTLADDACRLHAIVHRSLPCRRRWHTRALASDDGLSVHRQGVKSISCAYEGCWERLPPSRLRPAFLTRRRSHLRRFHPPAELCDRRRVAFAKTPCPGCRRRNLARCLHPRVQSPTSHLVG